MKKIIIGIDFNVLTVDNDYEIKRGVNLISFSIDKEGNLWQSVNATAYSTTNFDKFDVNNVFKHIKPDDLVKLVLSMHDKEIKVVNDNVTVIRLYNDY